MCGFYDFERVFPIISFEEYQTVSKTDDSREPILTAGFIHDF
ncbi:unnamed protein product, partial [Rotaria sp. Silwood1]